MDTGQQFEVLCHVAWEGQQRIRTTIEKDNHMRVSWKISPWTLSLGCGLWKSAVNVDAKGEVFGQVCRQCDNTCCSLHNWPSADQIQPSNAKHQQLDGRELAVSALKTRLRLSPSLRTGSCTLERLQRELEEETTGNWTLVSRRRMERLNFYLTQLLISQSFSNCTSTRYCLQIVCAVWAYWWQAAHLLYKQEMYAQNIFLWWKLVPHPQITSLGLWSWSRSLKQCIALCARHPMDNEGGHGLPAKKINSHKCDLCKRKMAYSEIVW